MHYNADDICYLVLLQYWHKQILAHYIPAAAKKIFKEIWEEVTCVSSMHSRKCVTLLKLRTELTINFFLLYSIFVDTFLWRTLNCHKSNLIPTLRARPEYQLSGDIHKAETNIPTNRPYTSSDWIFFCNQPLLVMRSRGEPYSTIVKVVKAIMV